MSYFEIIRRYRKTYRNWYAILYAAYRGGNLNMAVKLRTINKTLILDSYTAFLLTFFPPESLSDDNTTMSLKFNDRNIKLKLRETGEHFANGDIVSIFSRKEYAWLNPRNETVVDIGANIGDSCIYFAIEGATNVLAFEPYPYSFKLAKKNVEINCLNNKITVVNAGYGTDDIVSVSDGEASLGDNLQVKDNGITVPVYSLKTVINQYNLPEAVLKMDCEGCEVNLMNESDDTLRLFKRMQIEYHYGYENLKVRLEKAGFKVDYTLPKKLHFSSATNSRMRYGYIFAIRQE